jgi:hypothetical protein
MTYSANWLMTLALTAGFGMGAYETAATVPADRVDGAAAFARLKALEGTWVAQSKTGESKIVFELTAGGTVLLEHYSNAGLPGGGHMVTAYHLDGRDLILTHYCIANNQPVLRAERFDSRTGEIAFEFVRATNLATPKTGHMRRAIYKLQDATHFVTEWSFYEAGALKMTEAETFTRVQ